MEMVQTCTRTKKMAGGVGSHAKLKQSFILRSVLQPDERVQYSLWSEDEERWMPLLTIILSLILGSGRSIQHGKCLPLTHPERLKELLGKMNIDLEADSPDFGSMKELMLLWTRQGYLDKIKETGADMYIYVWGPRAKVLFPESKMAQFMLGMYHSTTAGEKEKVKRSLERLLAA
ncbi:hypothetical protein HDU91_006077 [Kappamyces sp. JEL0680]|nr:hypothetical protein HDU91_006077 [Kappamyces sp. JEL0680]